MPQKPDKASSTVSAYDFIPSAKVWENPTLRSAGGTTTGVMNRSCTQSALGGRRTGLAGVMCTIRLFGSGTTIIAAERQNRRCFAVEISPAYCDVVVERWETYTGKTAICQAARIPHLKDDGNGS